MNRKKFRVLFLTNIPSPYRVDFFNELGKLCDLTVLFERPYSRDREKDWHHHDFRNFGAVFLSGLKMGNDGAFCPEVIPYLRRKEHDAIVVGGYATPTGALAIQYLSMRRIPFLLNADGGQIRPGERSWKKILKKHFISKAAFWLSSSRETTDYLKHYGGNPERIFPYPFTSLLETDIIGSPMKRKEKELLRAKLHMKEKRIILSAGRFIPGKGFDVLLKAGFGMPDDFGIYIVGGKPPRDYLEMAARYHLHHVHFVDFLPKEQLKEYFLASDLFVLPTRSESWGLVINEAMACGLPVITTHTCVAGVELIENGENGYIIPPDNVEALRRRILDCLKNEEKRQAMALKSLEKIKPYTIPNMAAATMEIIERFIHFTGQSATREKPGMKNPDQERQLGEWGKNA
jgi:Glycosyl transferases group 1.